MIAVTAVALRPSTIQSRSPMEKSKTDYHRTDTSDFRPAPNLLYAPFYLILPGRRNVVNFAKISFKSL